METLAVVVEEPERVALRFLTLTPPQADDVVVSIDFSGPATAFAKVECQIPPRYFTDYLTLLKVDGRWQVIAKAFHTVTRDA